MVFLLLSFKLFSISTFVELLVAFLSHALLPFVLDNIFIVCVLGSYSTLYFGRSVSSVACRLEDMSNNKRIFFIFHNLSTASVYERTEVVDF